MKQSQPQYNLRHPIHHLLHVLEPEPRPLSVESVHLSVGELDKLWRSKDQVLLQIKAHAHVPSIAHDEGGVSGRGLDSMSPRELVVGDQESVAALATEPRLKGHEDTRGVAVTRDALAQHQLDSCDDPAAETQVLWKGPFGENGFQSHPQRAVILVSKPSGTVCGLQTDEGEEGGRVCGFEEEVLGDDDVEDVVHLI